MSPSKKTVLITAAGGAAVPGMIRRLKSAGYKVIAADTDQYAAGFYYADKAVVIPEGISPEFSGSILEICRKENVDAIIPLVDEELLKTADMEGHGIAVILPKKEFIKDCLDKYTLIKRLEDAGIPSLKTRLASAGASGFDFPVIVKPRTGRGGRGVEVVYSQESLKEMLKGADLERLIIQEYIDGPEFTISVVVWRDGEVQAVVPKEIISKKGITKVAVTRKVQAIEDLCRRVQKVLNADGPFNVQLRYDPVRELHFIFEINPRFSTSISLTTASGIDELCGIMAQALKGKDSYVFGEWKEGVVLLRQTLDEFMDEKDYAASLERVDNAKVEKIDKIEPILNIEKHPFFVGPVDPYKESELPKNLPFRLGVHPKYAIPRLILDSETITALEKAYSIGSMASTPLGESELSSVRMKEVLNKLLALFSGDVKGCKILELGSGKGALLNELKKMGAIVTGLEIGPQGKEAAERYGISIINKSFKKGVVNDKFDCIYSYGCIEHIIDLDVIFEASRDCLKDKGLFFHVVPNSGYYFDTVSLHHLAHEHVNYFTSFNGVNLFKAQGFCSAKSAFSCAGNELMLWGYYDSSAKPDWPVELVHKGEKELKIYAEKLREKIDKITSVLKEMISDGKTIGFYAGGFEYGIQLGGGIRYFDGDSYKHGKSWLTGMPVIESPQALKSAPVDNLIICKSHYFSAIAKNIEEMGLTKRMCIFNIETLGMKETV